MNWEADSKVDQILDLAVTALKRNQPISEHDITAIKVVGQVIVEQTHLFLLC